MADEPAHDRMLHAHVHIGDTGRHAHLHSGPGHMGFEHSHMHDHVTEETAAAPAEEPRPAVSYIVVEVRERDPLSPARDAGYLRSRLREVAGSTGLDAADVIIRSDRPDQAGWWQQARDLLAAVSARRRARASGDIPLDLHPAEKLGRRAELRSAQEER